MNLPAEILDERLNAPVELTAKEHKIWNQVVPRMQAAGLICSLDESLLIDYCETKVKIADLKSDLKEQGYFVERSNGPKSCELNTSCVNR